MWVISAIVLFYVTAGGFKSTVSVGVVQSWLFMLTILILGLIVYSFIGSFEIFGNALSKIASTPISALGEKLMVMEVEIIIVILLYLALFNG